jgi:hypothetical protein
MKGTPRPAGCHDRVISLKGERKQRTFPTPQQRRGFSAWEIDAIFEPHESQYLICGKLEARALACGIGGRKLQT